MEENQTQINSVPNAVPTTPVQPVTPVAPAAPVTPVQPAVETPVAPVTPVQPVAPVAPAQPAVETPSTPVAPVQPQVTPVAPTPVVENVVQTPVTPVQQEVTPVAPVQPTTVDMNAINPGMQVSQPASPVTETPKKKGKGALLAIIAILAIVLIGAGLAVYFVFIKPKTAKQVMNGTIDALFTKAANFEDSLANNLVLDYKTQTIDYQGSLILSAELKNAELKEQLGDLKSIELNYGFILNAKGQEVSFNANTKQNNKEILSLDGFIKGKSLYLNSNVFEHPYKEDMSDSIDWDELNVDELPEIDAQAYKRVTTKVQTYLKESIKEEYLTQEKGTYTVNGKSIDGYKNSIEMTEKIELEIEKSIIQKILADDEFVKDYANLTASTKDEVKNQLNDKLKDINETTAPSTDVTSILNIYTKASGELLGLEIIGKEEGSGALYIVKDGNMMNIKFNDGDEDYTATYNEDTKEFKTTYVEDEKSYDITVKLEDEKVTVTIVSDEITLTITAENKTSDKKIEGNFGVSADIKDDQYGLTASVTSKNSFEEVQSIKTFDTSKATVLSEMTEEEQSKILETALEKIKGTYLEKIYNLINAYSSAKTEYSDLDYDYDYDYTIQDYSTVDYDYSTYTNDED